MKTSETTVPGTLRDRFSKKSIEPVPAVPGTGLSCKTYWLLFLIVFFSFRLWADEEPVRDVFQTKIRPQQATITSQEPTAANLQGISIGPSGSFAVINGEVYRQGEEKVGIQVTQIRKKEVDVLISGAQRTLRMLPDLTASQPVSQPLLEEETLQETGEEAV